MGVDVKILVKKLIILTVVFSMFSFVLHDSAEAYASESSFLKALLTI